MTKKTKKFLKNIEAKALPYTVLFLLITVTFSGLFLVLPPENKSVKAAYWDTQSDWDYNQTLYIDNAVNSYQMRLNISYSDNNGDFDCDGNCQADFDDIRFVDIDGSTNLSYWIEETVNSDYCIFWVKAPSDATTDESIKMYYGNGTVSDVSSGPNTFLFYDDFSDNNYDSNPEWTGDSSYFDASTGYLERDSSFQIFKKMVTPVDMGDGRNLSWWFDMKQGRSTATPWDALFGFLTNGTQDQQDMTYKLDNDGAMISRYPPSNILIYGTNVSDWDWHSYRITSNGTYYFSLWEDGSYTGTAQDTYFADEGLAEYWDYIMFRPYDQGSIDNIRIGIYRDTEPSWNDTAPPDEDVSAFSLSGTDGNDRITWTGEAGETVWSNATTAGTLEINYNVNSSDNLSEIRINLSHINVSQGILNTNISLTIDDNNASWGTTTVAYSGTNITINESVWDAQAWCTGTNPFPIDGAGWTNGTIYVRFTLAIPSEASADTYTTDSHKVWFGVLQ